MEDSNRVVEASTHGNVDGSTSQRVVSGSGCRKRWATFIGGLASFDVIFSTVGRRTVVSGACVIRRRPAGRLAGRPAGRPGGARVVSGAEKKII